MKKLITGVIAAAALLFGFASCTGDLHDAEIIDLTDYCIIGPVTDTGSGWQPDGSVPLTANSDGTYTAEWTAVLGGQQSGGDKATGEAFAIIKKGDTNWSTAYRLAQPKAEGDTANVFKTNGDTQAVYLGQSADCMIISDAIVSKGDKIKITVTPGTTSLSVKVDVTASGGAATPVPYVLSGMFVLGTVVSPTWSASVDSALMTFTTDRDGNVFYTKDFTASGTSAEFKIATSNWNDGYSGAEVELDSGYVQFSQRRENGTTVYNTTTGEKIIETNGEAKGDTDNSKLTGLTSGSTYRLYIKTTPDELVYCQVVSLATVSITPTVTASGLPDALNGTELYFTGDFNGWKSPEESGISAKVTGNAISVTLPAMSKDFEGGAAKEFAVAGKFASAGWTKPEITNEEGGNISLTFTAEKTAAKGTFIKVNTISGNEKESENGDQYYCTWVVE